MAGRPQLPIGGRGKVKRIALGGGVWLARCRFRDSDGVVRVVERRGPDGVVDQYGKLAEEALLDALASRRPPGGDDLSLDTPVPTLVDRHIDRLEEDGRAIRTVDSYRYDATRLKKFMGGVRVGEATAARMDAVLRSVRAAHGAITARRSRTLLKGALQLAVLAEVLGHNPVRDVTAIAGKAKPQGAPGLDADQLRTMWANLQESDACRKADLTDAVTVLVATGLRRSELLALRWRDFDEAAATLTVSGKVVRRKGHGLVWVAEAKTAAGLRTVPLPAFAVQALKARRGIPFIGSRATIFASTSGSLRDPDNFNGQWRKVRQDLGVPDVTSHSFRRSLGTLIDEAGLSARVGADQLGHAKVSMTQDRYMSRGRVHTKVADIVQAVINDE